MNDGFSLAMGLFDFINPIMYASFFIYTLPKIRPYLIKWVYMVYLAGGILSLTAGILIPTTKCIVGLGLMTFELPVKIVAFVNTGFILSGFSVFFGTLKKFRNSEAKKAVKLRSIINPYSLLNSIVVLGGAVGLVLVYISYIKIALERKRKAGCYVLCYSLVMTLANSFVGAAMDTSASWVHWLIEVIAVSAHTCLFVGGLLIFREKNRVTDFLSKSDAGCLKLPSNAGEDSYNIFQYLLKILPTIKVGKPFFYFEMMVGGSGPAGLGGASGPAAKACSAARYRLLCRSRRYFTLPAAG